MHIIFAEVNNWHIPLLTILKLLKFKVFYVKIESKTELEQNKLATILKKKNIIPLPIEFEKNISSASACSLFTDDNDENSYKKNVQIIPDKILKKYCKLFSIDEKESKKLRLLLQDFIAVQQVQISAAAEIWSRLHPLKKIIFISFKLKSLYCSSMGRNVTKIILPIDFFALFMNFLFKNKKNKEQKKQIINNQNFEDLGKKSIALVTHQGIYYGSPGKSVLFEKSLYYSDDKNSALNKYNLLHLDYSEFSSQDKNIIWVNLKKINISKSKVFFKVFIALLKNFYLVRSWSLLFAYMFFIHKYKTYFEYCEALDKFINLKMVLISYDSLCPKTLLLAFQKKNIKTIACQERVITAFYKSYTNVFVDTYYVASEYIGEVIKKSKYYDIKNIIPVGQYRSDYLPFYKKLTAPKEISKAKDSGKKILIVLGNHSPKDWYVSYIDPILNWSAQIDFLEDMIKLSQNLKNTFVVIRYKHLEWTDNQYFKSILKKIYDCNNIIISNNYEELFSYKLCSHADLVIAKHTSLADECLSKEIPVLFHEYTQNIQILCCGIPNYLPRELLCLSYAELYEKSKSILFSNKFYEEIKQVNKKIYYVEKQKNIKKKILKDLEDQLIENKQ
jgi:hypothetical protein|tara:strand:+ start:231 stop:2081 length:1851 start_codon:yes stop_codon:yes gene_type:complete